MQRDFAAAEERAEKAEKLLADRWGGGYYALRQDMEQMKSQRDTLAAKLAEETRTLDNCREGHEAATEAISQLNEEVDEIKAKLEDAEEIIIGLRKIIADLALPADGLWEKLKPYLRHKEGCEALGVHIDDCTCGLEALMGGGK